MSKTLYVIGLGLINLAARFMSLFNPKAKAFVKGRKDWKAKLKDQLEGNSSPLLWVHASSVGEYEQGRPVIEAFKAQHPNYNVLVTFYSPSGYEAVSTDNIINYKAYLPFDSKSNAVEFISITKPSIAFFVKYEFWHFYLSELKNNNIPTFSVSSIFRPEQAFFKWYGGFFRKMLNSFTYFFVQDKSSQTLLENIGISSEITGDTRLDRVLAIKETEVSYPEIESFIDKPAIIIGSLRKEDIDIVTGFIDSNADYKFIIAPHEITEEMMTPFEAKFSCVRLSKYSEIESEKNILIIDSIGILSKVYRYGSYAYVGGGFSDGIHNIIEPTVYGIPVFFGNRDYKRFKEAIDLTEIGAAFPVANANELISKFQAFNTDKEKLGLISKSIDQYIELNRGASEKIIEHLDSFIK